MIYFVWTGTPVQGKGAELRESVKAMTKAAQKYVPNDIESCEMISNVTGDRNQFHVVTKFRSLSAWESYNEKVKNDKDFAAAVKKYTEASPMPIPGASGQLYLVEDLD